MRGRGYRGATAPRVVEGERPPLAGQQHQGGGAYDLGQRRPERRPARPRDGAGPARPPSRPPRPPRPPSRPSRFSVSTSLHCCPRVSRRACRWPSSSLAGWCSKPLAGTPAWWARPWPRPPGPSTTWPPTKVVCTTTLALLARQRGALALDDPVVRWLPVSTPTADDALAPAHAHGRPRRPRAVLCPGQRSGRHRGRPVRGGLQLGARRGGALFRPRLHAARMGARSLPRAQPRRCLRGRSSRAARAAPHAVPLRADRRRTAATDVNGDQRLGPASSGARCTTAMPTPSAVQPATPGFSLPSATWPVLCTPCSTRSPGRCSAESIALMSTRQASTGADVRGIGWRLEPENWVPGLRGPSGTPASPGLRCWSPRPGGPPSCSSPTVCTPTAAWTTRPRCGYSLAGGRGVPMTLPAPRHQPGTLAAGRRNAGRARGKLAAGRRHAGPHFATTRRGQTFGTARRRPILAAFRPRRYARGSTTWTCSARLNWSPSMARQTPVERPTPWPPPPLDQRRGRCGLRCGWRPGAGLSTSAPAPPAGSRYSTRRSSGHVQRARREWSKPCWPGAKGAIRARRRSRGRRAAGAAALEHLSVGERDVVSVSRPAAALLRPRGRCHAGRPVRPPSV